MFTKKSVQNLRLFFSLFSVAFSFSIFFLFSNFRFSSNSSKSFLASLTVSIVTPWVDLLDFLVFFALSFRSTLVSWFGTGWLMWRRCSSSGFSTVDDERLTRGVFGLLLKLHPVTVGYVNVLA